MSEAIIEFLRNICHNDAVVIILIAILPIVELRGAIPVAIAMGKSSVVSFLLAFLGSSIVIPILLFFLKWVLNLLKKFRWFRILALAIEEMFQHKAKEIEEKAVLKGKTTDGHIGEKFKFFAVLIFVAIPLPFTGVWTGTAIACFLDMKYSNAFLALLLGNFCAGILVTVLTTIFINYMNIILGVFAVIIIASICLFIWKLIKYVKIVRAKQTTNDLAKEK